MQSGLKSGWLEKRGRQLKGFHRRFFMLLRTGELWSCKDEYGKGMKVKLRLKKDRGTVTLVPRSDEDLPYDFFVEDDRGRSVYMRAGRRKDQQAWVQAFNGLLEGRDLDEIAAISGSSEPTSGGGAKTATALGVHGGRVGSGAHGSNLTASELQAGNDQVDASDEFGGAAAAAFAGLTMSQLENKSDWKTLTQHTIGLEKLGGKRHERLSPLWIQSEKTRQALQLMGDSFFRSGPAEPFTLVADASATRLLQHSFNIMERLSPTGQSGDDELDTLFKTKVTLDSLENRSTEPGAANVLYMMRPDWKEPNSKADSSELFLEDFTVGQPPFAAEKVAVLFLGPAGLRSLEKMSRCGVLRARLMCAPCVLPARHICFEGQAITMNMPTAFEDLYSSSETSGERTPFAVADELARGLVSMCAQLNEYPYIRYSTSSINCGMLAGKFYEALHEFIQVQTEFDFHGSVDLRDRSTVLLLDRNCDLKQPLLHDPCLEPCAFDYLGRQYLRDTYLLELNERNPEWALYRHMPVLSVWTSIQNRLVNCIYKNNDQKYRLTCIAKACTEIFDRIGDSASDEEEAYEKLTSILMLEQMMVTGVEWTGPPDQPKVFARPMDQASVSDDFLTIATSENTTTRKRLLALFLSTFPDISESVATRVINCVSLVDQTDAIDNLRNIPKPICMFSQPADPMAKERDEIKAAMRCANRQDASDRNYPKIADIVNDLVTKKLNRDEFPYVRDPPPSPGDEASASISLRRTRTALSAGASPVSKTKGARLFVVVLGGATYTELRHIYEQSQQSGVPIVLVSTHFLTAGAYLESLSKISFD